MATKGTESKAPAEAVPPKGARKVSRIQEQTPWTEFLETEHTLPEVIKDTKPAISYNPNRFPDEVVEVCRDLGLVPAWIAEPKTQNDFQIIKSFQNKGYVPVQRTNVSDARIARLFDSTGVIHNGPQVLFVVRKEQYKANRKAERELSVSQYEKAKEGEDGKGRLPYLVDPDVVMGQGATDFENPDQFGFDAPDLDSVVGERGSA